MQLLETMVPYASTIYIYVTIILGWNGGGTGNSGGGGGGASDIRTSTSLSSRIAVGGGGLKYLLFNRMWNSFSLLTINNTQYFLLYLLWISFFCVDSMSKLSKYVLKKLMQDLSSICTGAGGSALGFGGVGILK